MGRPAPFSAAIDRSSLISTTRRSASREAAWRYRTWPTWTRSKQPFANAMVRPAARSAWTAVRKASRDRRRPTLIRRARGGSADGAAADCVAQLAGADRGGPALHHDEPSGMIREARSVFERRTGPERQRHRRDHGVSRPGDVGDLI